MYLTRHAGIAFLFVFICLSLSPDAQSYQLKCEQQLEKATGYFNNHFYKLAKDTLDVLKTITNCPEQIRVKAMELEKNIQAAQICSSLADRVVRIGIARPDPFCKALTDFESVKCSPDSRVKQLKASFKASFGECPVASPEEDGLYNEAVKALGNNNLDLANQYLNTLISKYPSYQKIDSLRNQIRQKETEEADRLYNEALEALKQDDLRLAKQHLNTLISKYPSYPKIGSLQSQIREKEEADKLYSKAQAALERNKLDLAKQYLNELISKYPSYPKIGSLQRQINEREGQPPPPPKISEAKAYFKNKEYYRALDVLRYQSKNEEALSLIGQIEQSIEKERSAIHKAILPFYEGRYEESYRLLDELKDLSRQASALIEFYLGANDSTRFFLDGEKNATLKDSAYTHFYNTIELLPNFSPPQESISKRVLQQFKEAINSH
jgi:TolA-binding protein